MNETEVIKSLLEALQGWMDQPDTPEAYALAHDRAILAMEQAQKVITERLGPAQSSMTLRDYFATKALPTAIEHWKNVDADEDFGGIFQWESRGDGEETYSYDCLYAAEWAYLMADAMLEARKPKEQP